MADSDIIGKIKTAYPLQNKKRRQISDYILHNLSECCFLPLRKLSDEIGVTEVTMLNYCRSLGYQNFIDFRDNLRNYIAFWKHMNERTWEGIGESGKATNLASSVIESERDILSAILTGNGEAAFEKAAEMLLSAERIFIASHGASIVSAAYCERRLTSIGINTVNMDISDEHMVASSISQVSSEKALLIVIAITPHGLPTVRTANLCRNEGIPILAITDNPHSDIASYAQCAITAPASILGATNSILPSIAMIDVITIIASIKARNASPVEDERYRSMLETLSANN